MCLYIYIYHFVYGYMDGIVIWVSFHIVRCLYGHLFLSLNLYIQEQKIVIYNHPAV